VLGLGRVNVRHPRFGDDLDTVYTVYTYIQYVYRYFVVHVHVETADHLLLKDFVSLL